MERLIDGVSRIRSLFVRTLIIALVLCLCSLLLISCAGLQDWDYMLPNGYCVARANTNSISILSYDEAVVIYRHVTCFSYNEKYVCARRIDLPNEHISFEQLMSLDFEQAEYWIVNTETDETYDSLTKEEYDTLIAELNITNLCDWIDTYPRPDGAE